MSKIGFGRRVKKLTNLRLKEISGVDHPASLHEGWAVMKNTDNELTSELAEIINNEQNLENEVETEVQKEESVTDTDVVDNEVESTDVAKELADVRKELADAKAEVSQLKEDSAMEKAQTDSQKWAIVPQLDPVEFAPVLRSLRSFDTEVSEQIENILDAVAVALGEAGILKEIGSDGSPEHEDTYGQIESIAKSMVEEGTASSLADGIAKVAVAQPELYSAYVAEQRGA